MRYLMIQFIRKQNGQIDELVNVAKKIKMSDHSTKNVILDYARKTVEKCVIEGSDHDTTFDSMHLYYNKIYPTLIEQLVKEAPIEKETRKQKK